MNRKILNIILFSCLVFALACVKTKPPVQNDQWFCKTISDRPTDSVSLSVQPHQRAVAYKDKWWPVGYQFKIGFIGGTNSQKTFVKQTCIKWSESANLTFQFPASGPYDIRIAFNSADGAWSYVGTDCKSISANQPTMNLGWIGEDVVLHEFGHSIGLLHEHQNPTSPIKWNEAAVIADLSGPPNNWTLDMIRYNVLNPYPLPNVITTALDKMSVMMYPIPASWTLDGFTTPGGGTISDVDKKFIGERYPFKQPPTTGSVTLTAVQVDSIISRYNKTVSSFDSAAREVKTTGDLIKSLLGRK